MLEKTYKKYNSELLATSERFKLGSERKVELSITFESTQPVPHSSRHRDHGNCVANEAKK